MSFNRRNPDPTTTHSSPLDIPGKKNKGKSPVRSWDQRSKQTKQDHVVIDIPNGVDIDVDSESRKVTISSSIPTSTSTVAVRSRFLAELNKKIGDRNPRLNIQGEDYSDSESDYESTSDSDKPPKRNAKPKNRLVTERTPLIPKDTTESSGTDHITINDMPVVEKQHVPLENALAWAEETTFRRLVVRPFISGTSHFAQHWFADTVGFLAAVPGAINAFCMYTGIDPKNLIEGTSKMNGIELAFSITNAVASVTLNTAMNAWFLIGLIDDIKSSLKAFNSGSMGKISVTLATLIGLSAFCAAFGIGYAATLWLPGAEISALAPGILNAALTFASRFNGLIRIIERVQKALSNQFNQDHKLQNEALDVLGHINPHSVADLNEFLRGKKLDDDTVADLFTQIANQADNDESIIQEPGCVASCSKATSEFALTSFRILFASTITYFIFPTFTQKGFDGINSIVKLITKLKKADDQTPGFSLNDLDAATKGAIGSAPGLASALFFWFHMYDLSTVIAKSAEHLKGNKENIFQNIIYLVASIFSGSSMYNISTNIANRPGNIFGDHPAALFTKIKMWANGTAGALVNWKVIAANTNTVASTPLPTTSPTLDDVRKYMETHHLSHEAIDSLRYNSLFAVNQAPVSEPTTPVNGFDPGIV